MHLGSKSGCKVGWEFYSDEQEAQEAATRAAERAADKLDRGYDFGYQTPGTVKHFDNHPEHGDCYMVTVP